MGGYGSTRWEGHARWASVEESLQLAVGSLRQHLREAGEQSCNFRWSRSGVTEAEVDICLGALTTLEDGDATERHPRGEPPSRSPLSRKLIFQYAIGRGDETHIVKQEVDLFALPMRFGGYRWWLECPRCHSQRMALYLPAQAGGRDWRCRSCYKLKYEAQRRDPIGRAEQRMRRVWDRLRPSSQAPWLDFPPPKPKWMRRLTYTRCVAVWESASAVREQAYGVGLERLLRRLRRHHSRWR